MVEFEDYLNQIKNSKYHNSNLDIGDFRVLFELYQGEKNNIDGSLLVDKIIKNIFSLYGQHEFLVPFSFFDTPLGKVCLKVKYEIKSEKKYFVKDVAEILGVSRQSVLKDIHNEICNAKKEGRDWIMTEMQVNDYLVKKGKKPLVLYPEQEEGFIIPDNESEEKYNTSGYNV